MSDARRGFETKLTRHDSENFAPDDPPAGVLRLVKYDSPSGSLAAYVSLAPADGKKHPAIIWLVGGFSNSISEYSWLPAKPSNDQSARAFREAGVITMYPSLRGGNNNPGYKERFFGEVDDALAAARFLAKQDGVDPNAIYLGGHSTGGTLALLCAEMPNPFRAVFSFGPVRDVRSYGTKDAPFDASDLHEVVPRSPAYWLDSIQVPTFIFVGTKKPSNLGELRAIRAKTTNPQVHCLEIKGATHFSTLAPATALIARKIIAADAGKTDVSFDQGELDRLVQ
ncbi:MAG TPA: prolyl oligopeptidase family serine peptidase [Tepidisphaeraceae bacterium]